MSESTKPMMVHLISCIAVLGSGFAFGETFTSEVCAFVSMVQGDFRNAGLQARIFTLCIFTTYTGDVTSRTDPLFQIIKLSPGAAPTSDL